MSNTMTAEKALEIVWQSADILRNDVGPVSAKKLFDAHLAISVERDALRAEVEALRADAKRYRWLRENAKPDDLWYEDVVLRFPGPDIDGFNSLDEVIDAALAEARK